MSATDTAELTAQIDLLCEEVSDLRQLVDKLSDRLERLES